MSNLPPAARRQVKAANDLIASQHQNKGAAPPPVALSPVPGAQPAQTINLQPVPEFPNVGADQSGFQPPSQPAVAPAQPPEGVAEVPPVGAQPVGENWEHKFKVLQGKYTSETRRAREEIGTLRTTVNNLAATRNVPQAAQPPAPQAAPQTPKERALAVGISEKELDEYGPELVDMIMRVATNLNAPQIRQLADAQRQLGSMVQTSVQNSQRSSREMLYDQLLDQVPDWEDVNNSSEFLDWLAEDDIFSGQTRKVGLMQAFEGNDTRRVIQIFRAFKAEDERARSTTRVPAVNAVTLIAPGTPGGSSAPAQPGSSGEMIHEREIADFFNAVRMGKIKGEARNAREAVINLAVSQGRVIPTHAERHIQNSR